MGTSEQSSAPPPRRLRPGRNPAKRGARPHRLAANARPFRYGFYPLLALGFLALQQPALEQAAPVFLWCLLWPALADWILKGGDARRSLRLHLAEALLTCFLLAWAGFQQALLGAICILLTMSNALQGGLWQALKAALAAGLGTAFGLSISPVAAALPSPSSAFAGLLLLAYCTLVGHVAFARVLATQGERAEIRAQNARLQQYLPHTLAERLRVPDRARLERRWLVVAFADLAGFTRLVERLPVEELATMLDDYLKCVARVTQRFGGAVSKLLGDGALLVFGEVGTPDRRRLVADALACALELDEQLAKLTDHWRGLGLPESTRLKTGVASGYCSLGDWGGAGRLEYTVIGQPVNLASRLQDLAAAGEILLCERTALLADIPLSSARERRVKGLGEVRFRKVAAAAAALECAPR